jgi:dCTP deaminase
MHTWSFAGESPNPSQAVSHWPVLSRRDIPDRIERGDTAFTPKIEPGAIKQCSVDLRLGRTFTISKIPDILPRFESAFQQADLWDQKIDQDVFTLRPGQLVLAQTLEVVHLPNDLMGLLEGRSQLGEIWCRSTYYRAENQPRL